MLQSDLRWFVDPVRLWSRVLVLLLPGAPFRAPAPSFQVSQLPRASSLLLRSGITVSCFPSPPLALHASLCTPAGSIQSATFDPLVFPLQPTLPRPLPFTKQNDAPRASPLLSPRCCRAAGTALRVPRRAQQAGFSPWQAICGFGGAPVMTCLYQRSRLHKRR